MRIVIGVLLQVEGNKIVVLPGTSPNRTTLCDPEQVSPVKNHERNVAWPYAVLGIMPTNRRVMAASQESAGPDTRQLIESWGRLHAGRSGLGLAATITFVWAALRNFQS
jgi:hypothetical protein